MLELNFIRTQKERVIRGLKVRNYTEEDLKIIDDIIALDDARKAAQVEMDNNLAETKKLSKEIGGLFQQGKQTEAGALKAKVGGLKANIKTLEATMKDAMQRLEELLLSVPNIPHESVPAGKTPEDNEVYKAWENPLPELGEGALPHWELATKYNLFDLELGVKITGAGFPVYRGKGARLERALINFFLDEATAAGYEEVIPPLMVNEDTARATGQLVTLVDEPVPDFADADRWLTR
ncbi:MAG: hypothetical protein ACE5EK_10500 [Nitrospinales bacterium]